MHVNLVLGTWKNYSPEAFKKSQLILVHKSMKATLVLSLETQLRHSSDAEPLLRHDTVCPFVRPEPYWLLRALGAATGRLGVLGFGVRVEV